MSLWQKLSILLVSWTPSFPDKLIPYFFSPIRTKTNMCSMFITYKHIEAYWKIRNQAKYTLYTHVFIQKREVWSFWVLSHPFVVRHKASNELFVYKWVNSGVIEMPWRWYKIELLPTCPAKKQRPRELSSPSGGGQNNFFCNWHHMCLCMGGGGGLLLTVSTPGQALRQLISWYWCKRPLPRTPCPPYTHQARGGWLYLLSLAQHTLRRCRLGGSWGASWLLAQNWEVWDGRGD